MEKLYTLNELAAMLDRDRHTCWHHVKKLGVGRIIGRMFFFTKKECDYVLKYAYRYRINDRKVMMPKKTNTAERATDLKKTQCYK